MERAGKKKKRQPGCCLRKQRLSAVRAYLLFSPVLGKRAFLDNLACVEAVRLNIVQLVAFGKAALIERKREEKKKEEERRQMRILVTKSNSSLAPKCLEGPGRDCRKGGPVRPKDEKKVG